MNEDYLTAVLGIVYPFLVIIFWALVVVAIVWGITKLIKNAKNKSSKN